MRVAQAQNAQQQQAENQQQQQINGKAPGAEHPILPGNVPPMSPSPPLSLSFTDSQLNTLKAQMAAWRYVQRNAPIPDNIHTASRSVPAVPEAPAAPLGRFEEDPNSLEHNENSGIFPFNAYLTPLSRLNAVPLKQRVLMPTVFPDGLDVLEILSERRRYIEARIEQRVKELSILPSTLGTSLADPPIINNSGKRPTLRNSFPNHTAHGKLRLLIEQKGLLLRQKQRNLRQTVAEKMLHGTVVPTDRKEFRRTRKPLLRDARMTEAAERKQRLEREKRAKQKHLDYLKVICTHGQNLLAENRNNLSKVQRLGKSVGKFHAETEREEQKRIERVSRERLRALKNDDEEAYLKLIDTAKDTRITHLLRQTDQYLDSLAQAVVAQQHEAGARHGMPAFTGQFDQIDGPIDETAFGASKLEDPDEKGKVDYYRVAHRINEKVDTQPRMLTGGTLKEYQLKGLQWMVSLYNNKLDGILADEMGYVLSRQSSTMLLNSLSLFRLGKTIQTISLITFLIERKNEPGPYLVVVPLSTLTNWSLEFAKWAPTLVVLAYKGSPNVRRNLQAQLRNPFHVLLTTYEYIIKDRPILCKNRWTHMIIGWYSLYGANFLLIVIRRGSSYEEYQQQAFADSYAILYGATSPYSYRNSSSEQPT